MRASNRSAFTLLELLVVSAILAVLFALAAAGVGSGKSAAHRMTCVNNLRQWGYAARLYADENNDELPREAAVDGINSWEMTGSSTNRDVWYNALAETAGVTTMGQYAQAPSSQQEFYSRGNIFHCPSARFSEVAATYPNFSLAINSKLMDPFEFNADANASFGRSKGLKMAAIKVPERTALFLDNGIPAEEKLCLFQATYTGQPKADASQFPGRHRGGANILFVAGHVLSLAGKDVVEMNPNSVHCGRAIYPPTEVIWRHDPKLVP